MSKIGKIRDPKLWLKIDGHSLLSFEYYTWFKHYSLYKLTSNHGCSSFHANRKLCSKMPKKRWDEILTFCSMDHHHPLLVRSVWFLWKVLILLVSSEFLHSRLMNPYSILIRIVSSRFHSRNTMLCMIYTILRTVWSGFGLMCLSMGSPGILVTIAIRAQMIGKEYNASFRMTPRGKHITYRNYHSQWWIFKASRHIPLET